MMVDLSDQERRLLVLAMGALSLTGIIMEQGSLLSSELLSECETKLGEASLEFDALFLQVDNVELAKKLTDSDLLPASDLSTKLRRELDV